MPQGLNPPNHYVPQTGQGRNSNKTNCCEVICWCYILPRNKEDALPWQAWQNSHAYSLTFEAPLPAGNRKLDMPSPRKHVFSCMGCDERLLHTSGILVSQIRKRDVPLKEWVLSVVLNAPGLD